MGTEFKVGRIGDRLSVDETTELANSIIKPQLPQLAKRFQDLCHDIVFSGKLTEWERTRRAEEAVGRYVREQIEVVAASLDTVLRNTGIELTADEIAAAFASLVPEFGRTRDFVYQTLVGFGIPGTPGVGIELDNAFRGTTELHSANLRLLGSRLKAAKCSPEEAQRMAGTQKQHDAIAPSLEYGRAQSALTEQLSKLEGLKGRSCAEADSDETEWEHFTQSIIERTFGNPSSNLTKFSAARNAGIRSITGVDEHQRQSNFERRLREYESLLKSLISEIGLFLPSDIKGAYQSGEEYAFYRDLTGLVAAVSREIFIVDAYLDEKVFNLYVSKAPSGVAVKLLSNNLGPNVTTVAKMYAKSATLELRVSSSIHDRAVFFDGRGWVVGQSIKDAAKSKPTYMVELADPVRSATRVAYDNIWSGASVVV